MLERSKVGMAVAPEDSRLDWLMEAEREAGLEKLVGSLWHAYQRKCATERIHLPDVDVAAAGGWADTTTLKKVYQQADQERMLRVVSELMELREA